MKLDPGIPAQQSAAATSPVAAAPAPPCAAPAASPPPTRSAKTGSDRNVEPGPSDGHGRLPGAARKAQIVQETLRLVAEYGLVGASMSRIAEAVGISNAALYRHFDSREDILIAAHDKLIERVFDWLNSSQAPQVIDRLHEMGRSHAHLFSRDIEGFNAPMFQFITWIPRDRVHDHVVRRRKEMLQWYADLVEEGKAQGSIRTDIETDLIVAELFAWIWWEDLSYLEGLDTEVTLRGSANMFNRLLERIGISAADPALSTGSADDVPVHDPTHATRADDPSTPHDGSIKEP
jgi:AcrR family transcriptional regulator